eukprot:TRINITY_DN12989_c0_g1_i1.p1 TRINITY_DN12989_c0_g1~~TRINITY_DN12989_c0_g1_i1.p1  ORF type:complete len:257 (+),score=55.93 TRINITY_DN12989_c0_g1_i1:34-804(+)
MSNAPATSFLKTPHMASTLTTLSLALPHADRAWVLKLLEQPFVPYPALLKAIELHKKAVSLKQNKQKGSEREGKDEGEHSGEDISLTSLLKGSRVFVAPSVDVPKDPKLTKRLQKLSAEAEQRAYNRMTSNLNPLNNPKPDKGLGIKDMMSEASFPFHVLITAICGFVFGYFFTWYWWSSQFWSIIAGSFCGMSLFLVDVLLLTVKRRQVDIHDEKHEAKPKFFFGPKGSSKLLTREEVSQLDTAVTDEEDWKPSE